ncbi:hypothetical protein MMC13_007353 [Lambiella insularis]|nr:hypothetical protein [Lambiella insularis]
MASEPVFTETTPFLASSTHVPSTSDPKRETGSHNHVMNILYAMISLIMCGVYLELAPRTEIYESIICRAYYASIDGHEYNQSLQDCKVTAVQNKLALVKGGERLLELVPSIFAIPYGLLANRWGRRNVLSLGLFGWAISDAWALIICLILIFASIVITTLLPNTKPQTASVAASTKDIDEEDDDNMAPRKTPRLTQRLKAALQKAQTSAAAVTANGQVILLLAMTLLIMLGRESLLVLLLQYITKRYKWEYASPHTLSSSHSTQLLFLLLLLLPLFSDTLLHTLHLPPLAADRHLALASSFVLTLGAFCLGLAPHISIAITGKPSLNSPTLPAPFTPFLLPRLPTNLTPLRNHPHHATPESVSVMYSLMTALLVAGSSLAGPLYNAAFVAGLRLGEGWVGLPYLVAGGLLALVVGMGWFVRGERKGEEGAEVER